MWIKWLETWGVHLLEWINSTRFLISSERILVHPGPTFKHQGWTRSGQVFKGIEVVCEYSCLYWTTARSFKSKEKWYFHSFFSQGVCYFCSLVMSDCGENGLSDSGIDWIEELCCYKVHRNHFTTVWKSVDGQSLARMTFPKTTLIFAKWKRGWAMKRGCMI